MTGAQSPPPQPQAVKRSRQASACRVTASYGPAPLRTWWTTLGTVLELRQPRDHHQVEARLLRVGLAELLAHQVAQRALQPGDRAAEPPGRAHQCRVGLDHRPLHELFDRDLVGGLDDEPREVLAEARRPRPLESFLRCHATTSVPMSR